MGARHLQLLLVLAIAAAPAAAQVLYRYVDAQGRIIYTDDAAKAGPNARRIEPPPAPKPQPAARAGGSASTGGFSRTDALDAAVDDIAIYDRQLKSAEARRDRGVEPLEGERVGRLLRPEYWERQQQLQRDVEDARARLDDAWSRRNALK